MIKVLSVLQTIDAFSEVFEIHSLAKVAHQYVHNREMYNNISEEEFILQYCLNETVLQSIYDPRNPPLKPTSKSPWVSMCQWISMSHWHEGEAPADWPVPKTIALCRGGQQVSREVLFGFEYAAIDLLVNKKETPLGKHVLKYAEKYPSEYKAVTLALVLKNHPFVSE
jgi:hypothetical protein